MSLLYWLVRRGRLSSKFWKHLDYEAKAGEPGLLAFDPIKANQALILGYLVPRAEMRREIAATRLILCDLASICIQEVDPVQPITALIYATSMHISDRSVRIDVHSDWI